jgi:nitrogen regulatory protein PII
MMMITAVIQPFRLEHVKAALLSSGIAGLTVSECVGHGRDAKLVPSVHVGPDLPDITPRIRIDVAVSEDSSTAAMDAIVAGTRIGTTAAGKLFQAPLEKVISISTGAVDNEALEARIPVHDAAE